MKQMKEPIWKLSGRGTLPAGKISTYKNPKRVCV
jgi:hypothetical protein